jgi:hypothetical protein
VIRFLAFHFWNGLAAIVLCFTGALLAFGRYCMRQAEAIGDEDNIK